MQQAVTHNQPEYTVSEISGAIKRTVEGNFGYVRVRGEISQPKLHTSGHLYLSLKDKDACLGAVCWKGTVSKLKIKAEEGLEVIATGKISTFGAQSKYQLIIDSIEAAGAGALMALLEKRKKDLAAKGLFDQSRKKPLPFMPTRIGVVTSPTGAVIRDILHRIEERFPCHVLVWPVRVQGQTAHCEVADAIKGFNELPAELRPQVLIVARGGGSLEDLWCFNEEAVVYAVADSKIPVISAVGHETDTTLIDYVADKRAPTPTAAAEFATEILADWKYTVAEYGNRTRHGLSRLLQQKKSDVSGLVRGLPKLSDIMNNYLQKLDNYAERLHNALPNFVMRHERRLAGLKLSPKILKNDIDKLGEKVHGIASRLSNSYNIYIERRQYRVETATKLFDSYNYKNVLQRGFALVKDENNKLIKSAADAKGKMQIEFADGIKQVTSQ